MCVTPGLRRSSNTVFAASLLSEAILGGQFG